MRRSGLAIRYRVSEIEGHPGVEGMTRDVTEESPRSPTAGEEDLSERVAPREHLLSHATPDGVPGGGKAQEGAQGSPPGTPLGAL